MLKFNNNVQVPAGFMSGIILFQEEEGILAKHPSQKDELQLLASVKKVILISTPIYLKT